MIINFVHSDKDIYIAECENLRISYNAAKQFRYTFWQHDFICSSWFSNTGIDLLYISFSVFIADRLCKREDASDNWSRNIELHIPVLEYTLWNENVLLLQNTLSFLSGDHWKIFFRPREKSDIEVFAENRWKKKTRSEKTQMFSMVSKLS